MKKKIPSTSQKTGGQEAPSGMVTRELTRTEWRVIQLLRKPLPPLDPEKISAAVLDFMLACEVELGLKPQKLQGLTGRKTGVTRSPEAKDA